jgi:hypothetical protein
VLALTVDAMVRERPPSGPAAAGTPPGGPRRGPRRRHRGKRRDDGRTPPPAVAKPPPPVLPAVSHLAEAGAGVEPLAAGEIAEMKEHLAFLRAYKDVLRLRLNAAEDLLVNGRREPADRGVCRHLLGKVDRAVIEAAIGREPLHSDPAARARMLAGAIRLTADVGVLLTYLETLPQVRSRTEAAQAFAEVVRRIDFESLSAARLGRLLQVLTETFEGHERVQVLFSLLAEPTFRRAFDAAAPVLPPEVAPIFAPLRAVHRRLLEDASASAAPADLAAGMEQVLSAPDPLLRGYAEPLRARMLELALDPAVPAPLADRASGVLLSSLARSGRTYTRLALRRAAQLLARHADDRARAVLEELRRAQPGQRTAERWLGALDHRRLGRVALEAGESEAGRLLPGLWLDGQRTVWLRTAPAGAAARLEAEALLQAALALPGVAPVVEHGVASGIPYVAVAAPGRPLHAPAESPRDLASALALAVSGARVLRALALAGAVLPDAEPARFLRPAQGPPSLVLADLDGVLPADPEAAGAAHVALAIGLARTLLPPDAAAHLAAEAGGEPLARALAGGLSLAELIDALDRAALRAGRD